MGYLTICPSRPVGVSAAGGGAARGFAHIGVIRTIVSASGKPSLPGTRTTTSGRSPERPKRHSARRSIAGASASSAPGSGRDISAASGVDSVCHARHATALAAEYVPRSRRALAQIVIPAMPELTGVAVHHAYGVLDSYYNLVFASEASSLEMIP